MNHTGDGGHAEDGGTRRRRKSRSLRSTLALTLIGVSLFAVLLLGLLNYLGARGLLTGVVDQQLQAAAAARTQAIENQLALFKGAVAGVAQDESITEALIALSSGYDGLRSQPEGLTPDQFAELETYYQTEVIEPVTAAGGEAPPLDELIPDSPAGQYLQYHYVVDNPLPPEERRNFTGAEDDSAYTAAHRTYHGPIAEMATTLGVDDVLLVARGEDAVVVYSTDKRIDLGTSLVHDAFADTELATALLEDLAAVPAGDAILVDLEPYLPSGEPRMFVAAAVRDDSRVVGVIAAEVAVERLNQITSAGGDWQGIGLGKTGETYVVGRDSLMRTDARLWTEDPEAYLAAVRDAGYSDDVAARIDRLDSTAAAQPVDTEAVAQAQDGKEVLQVEDNYLGDKTVTVARPLGVDELGWVVVAGLAADEADNALNSYILRVALIALILVPLVGATAAFLAGRLTRPVEPLVDTAAAVAGGDLDAQAPDLGRNEYGDLANRLNTLTSDLRAEEATRAAEEEEITSLLVAALPQRLVEGFRRGDRKPEDVVSTCTVIALSLTGLFDESSPDQEEALEFSSLLSRDIEAIADGLGIERVRSSSDDHMFTAGLTIEGTASDDAAAFTQEIRDRLTAFVEETGVQATFRIGLAAGNVATGIYGGNQLSYGVWGEPVRIAIALNAIAGHGQILVHESVSASLGPEWDLEVRTGLVDLQGVAIPASLLVGRHNASEVPVEGS